MLQGVGLVAEQVFTRITGRRVHGIFGRLWLAAMLGLPGADLTQAWSVGKASFPSRYVGLYPLTESRYVLSRLGRGLLDFQPDPTDWVSRPKPFPSWVMHIPELIWVRHPDRFLAGMVAVAAHALLRSALAMNQRARGEM